ncbi:TetR family transcriptional regulator [Nonomuraea fuscirosea]|uniref:TetR/AcrR family transcriptional regulator n=1 Tax=Nonomuraea fuscirosea TaxID=1291556 RepID=UPI00341A1FF6
MNNRESHPDAGNDQEQRADARNNRESQPDTRNNQVPRADTRNNRELRADAGHNQESRAETRNDREMRADARRNREQVLRTAQRLFAAQGLGISLDEIARHAGVGPGTVHRHFPSKQALYLAVAIDQIRQLVAEGEALAGTGDPGALFTLLSRMMASGAENAAVKSALTAAEFDLRDAAPDAAADLTHQVARLLDRAHSAGVVRADVTVDEVMAIVAGAFAAIQHAGADTSRERCAHLARIILDGLRPPSRR